MRERFCTPSVLAREVQRIHTMLEPETNGSAVRPVPSLTDSLDRMVDAAQKVVGDEISLLRVEVMTTVSTALRGAVMVLLGTALLTLGWVVVLMGAFQLLTDRLGSLGALGVLAAVNLVPGIVLLVLARRGWTELGNG